MNSTQTGRFLTLHLALLASVFLGDRANAQHIWQPNPNPGAGPGVWSNGAHWNGGVPGPSGNVLIPGGGPVLDVNATIGSLTIDGFGRLSGRKNLTVTGTTSQQNGGSYALDAETGATFSLGTLANYSNGVLTGRYACDDSWIPSAPTIIEFRGANITELRGDIYFFGLGAQIRDQDSGLNALRNLAVNRGYFLVEDTTPFGTTGNLTNHGAFQIYDAFDAPRTTYSVNGSLTNGENGYLEVYGNAEIIVKANLLNDSAPDGEIYINNDSRTPPGDAILSVDGDLVNATGGTIYVEGEDGRQARLVVKGSMTNHGDIILEGTGSMQVNGVLTVGAGSSIKLTGAPGIETFMMTAARIDAAAGSAFGARGTIFADLTERGVFYPGASPGRVTINGNIVFENTAELQVELGGTTAGTQYDQIVQQSTGSGGVTLGGKLAIAFVNGFESTLQNSDTFTILTSDLALSGAFSNVGNGGRLHTSNGSSSFQVNYSGNNVVLSNVAAEPLVLDNAYSQRVHGSEAFQIPLPLSGTTGIECRRSAVAGEQQVVFVFTNALTSGQATIMGGVGTIASQSIGANTLVVNLTGVANEQTLTLTLTNVTDTLGQTLAPAAVSMRVLLGDSNGDGTVNAGDALQTRSRSGQPASAINFRSDVNCDGTVNGGDAFVVKSRSGTSAP